MNLTKKEEAIRQEILNIKETFYTPTTKIADACGIDRSIMSKILNDSMEDNRKVPDGTFEALEKWLKDRKI